MDLPRPVSSGHSSYADYDYLKYYSPDQYKSRKGSPPETPFPLLDGSHPLPQDFFTFPSPPPPATTTIGTGSTTPATRLASYLPHPQTFQTFGTLPRPTTSAPHSLQLQPLWTLGPRLQNLTDPTNQTSPRQTVPNFVEYPSWRPEPSLFEGYPIPIRNVIGAGGVIKKVICRRHSFKNMEPETEPLPAQDEDLAGDEEDGDNDKGKPLSERNEKQDKTSTPDPKLCGVCGDKALGNNFNAITCESCKAFFRRNALRTKEFICPFNSNCKVDPLTRRFCQKCRLKKCFDIGMKKEWIMTEEEKKMKKQKIEQNRLKRGPSTDAVGGDPKVRALMSPSEGGVPPQTSSSDTNSNSSSESHNFGLQQIPGTGVPLLETHPHKNVNYTEIQFEESASHPPQHPILASLVRPGFSPESPPEETEAVPASTSASSSPDSNYPTKKKALLHQYNQEMTHQIGSEDELLEANSPPPNLSQAQPHHTHYLDYIHSSSHRDQDFPPLPLNTMESILSVAISAEFNALGFNEGSNNDDYHTHHSPDPTATQESSCGRGNLALNSRSLNKAEKAKLSELFFASEALNAPVDLDGPIKIATSDPSLINVINLTDIAIRRLIKMSKKMNAFKNMCQEDQIALLKGGCTEMMILRSVVSYDPERDSWNIPHSNGFNVKLGVLKEARGNLYEQHQRFVKSFKGEWRGDYNIMIILCAITLFTPGRPNVIHKDVVKLEQDSYYYLLKRYLESTRNGCEARSTYLQLIQRIAELHILNSNHLRVFLEVNPREVEPLLIEIFDLKQ